MIEYRAVMLTGRTRRPLPWVSTRAAAGNQQAYIASLGFRWEIEQRTTSNPSNTLSTPKPSSPGSIPNATCISRRPGTSQSW